MDITQLEALAKASQSLGMQINSLISTHQKSASSYASMITNIGQGTLSLEPRLERKALKQMTKSIKLAENGITKLTRINDILTQLEAEIKSK